MHKLLLFFFSAFLLIVGCNENKKDSSQVVKSLNMLSPQNKIWAHQVNSLLEVDQRIQNFYGIELDIFYEPKKDQFTVKHDLDSVGVNLEQFLDSILVIKKVSFWFDYKNLNEDTEGGISRLTSIMHEKDLENQCFVESYFASELEGFVGKLATSLWIPQMEVPTEKGKRDSLFQNQYKNFDSFNSDMLSASYEMFEFVSEYFPNRKCNFWISGERSKDQNILIKEMANSPNVNVILIDGEKNPVK